MYQEHDFKFTNSLVQMGVVKVLVSSKHNKNDVVYLALGFKTIQI